MTPSSDPWYITALTLIIGLGGLGLITMTVMPREWQNGQGWLMVSYLFLPGGLVLIALLVSAPALLFGALFLIGIFAAGK